jgi:hypothetical protein
MKKGDSTDTMKVAAAVTVQTLQKEVARPLRKEVVLLPAEAVLLKAHPAEDAPRAAAPAGPDLPPVVAIPASNAIPADSSPAAAAGPVMAAGEIPAAAAVQVAAGAVPAAAAARAAVKNCGKKFSIKIIFCRNSIKSAHFVRELDSVQFWFDDAFHYNKQIELSTTLFVCS